MSEKKPFIEIIPDQCKGCELCIHACPKKCIYLSDSVNQLGYKYAISKQEDCLGCGACFHACPEPGTIKVKKPKRIVKKDEERAN